MSTTTLTLSPEPRRSWRRWLVKLTTPPAWKLRLVETEFPDEGLGFDRFGLEHETALLTLGLGHRLAELGFELHSTGGERLPTRGPFILAAETMMAPFWVGAMLITIDVLAQLPKPRLVRTLLAPTWADVPWAGQWLSRAGFVWLTPEHMASLARMDQPMLLIPGQQRSDDLMSPALIELALKHDAPFVPVAVRRGPGLTNTVEIHYGTPLRLGELLRDRPLTPVALRMLTDAVQRHVQEELQPPGLGMEGRR
ncbi:MAG: hypothetical protein AAFS10_04000 [Myxococcota bacterium]